MAVHYWNKKNKFDISPKCIKEIILGCNISDAHRVEITDLVKNDPSLSHVQVQKADQDIYSQKLKVISI